MNVQPATTPYHPSNITNQNVSPNEIQTSNVHISYFRFKRTSMATESTWKFKQSTKILTWPLLMILKKYQERIIEIITQIYSFPFRYIKIYARLSISKLLNTSDEIGLYGSQYQDRVNEWYLLNITGLTGNTSYTVCTHWFNYKIQPLPPTRKQPKNANRRHVYFDGQFRSPC